MGNVSLVGCNSSIVFFIFVATGSSFSTNSIFIVNYIALYLMNGVSIGFNVLCVGRDTVFMVGNFIAIGLDSILVVLNLASICLDVFLILANLSILFVLLTLDGCKTASHCLIQLAICSFTFRSFLLVSFIAGSYFIVNGLRVGCNGSVVFFIFVATGSSFISYGIGAVLYFFMNCICVGCNVSLVGCNVALVGSDISLIRVNLLELFRSGADVINLFR